jgi:tetratricopeptide (TPR) repeat protein
MRAKKSAILGKSVEPIDFAFDPLLFDNGNFNHSEFLQKQGERSLLEGDLKGLQYFDLAADLDKENHKLFYQQGLFLFQYGSKEKKKKYLLLASKKFKIASKLQPEFPLIWHAWANTLSFLGQTYCEHHFLQEAKEKFQIAISLLSSKDEFFVKTHHDNALLMAKIAQYSGEVSDLQESLKSFKLASEWKDQLSTEFWQDYANIALILGRQIRDTRYTIQAISFFKEALNKNSSSYSLWQDLAIALSDLYDDTHDEDHFCQANECFANSANLNPQNSNLWATWAELLKNSGKRLKDTKRLHSALEKCHRAFSCNRKNALIIVTWAESLASLGLLTERLDLIYEANNKSLDAIDKFGASPELCKAIGISLFSLGKYYNDLDYYYQAVERFQEGLSINRTYHELWYYLGHAYSIAAEIESDPHLYERAAKFFAKAIHLHPSSDYYFEYAMTLSKLAIQQQDEKNLELSILYFEQAFTLQKNASYLHPDWLYQYAIALDSMGDMFEEEVYYERACEILTRVLLIDPDYLEIHFRLGIVYTHLGEMIQIEEPFLRAIQHFKIAFQQDEENDSLLLEWGLLLINLSEIRHQEEDKLLLFEEAEFKLMQSAKLGNAHAYYHLACLFSLQNQFEKSFFFLKKAHHYEGIPPLNDILEDLWLEGLRRTERFQDFIGYFERPEDYSEK